MNNINNNNNSMCDNEITAVQALLALRDPNSLNDINSNTDLLYSVHNLHSSSKNQPNAASKSYFSSSAYNSPINSETNDDLVRGMNAMTTYEQSPLSSPQSVPSSSPSSTNNMIHYNSQTQLIKQAQRQAEEQEHQFQEFQRQAQQAHQAQLVLQSQQPTYCIHPQPPPQQSHPNFFHPQKRILPSIQEMMSLHPSLSPTSSRNSSPTRSTASHIYSIIPSTPSSRAVTLPYHPYIMKYPASSLGKIEKHNYTISEARKQRIEQHQQSQQRNLQETQLKQQHVLHQNQLLETRMLLQSHENRRLLADLQNRSESELQEFFQGLRQHYRDEYDREFLEQREQGHNNMDETEDEKENEEEDSDYQLESCSSTSIVASSAKKTTGKYKKKSNGGVDKPRWTADQKAELFEAIVRHKSLDVMATFDWNVIGADIGRLDKACKDQWRRGILKMFREFVINN